MSSQQQWVVGDWFVRAHSRTGLIAPDERQHRVGRVDEAGGYLIPRCRPNGQLITEFCVRSVTVALCEKCEALP